MTLLNQTVLRLRDAQHGDHKRQQFETLKVFLTGAEPVGGYASVFGSIGLTEPAARMAVSRLRNRYREILRNEILKTVASTQDVDDEIKCLFRAISVR